MKVYMKLTGIIISSMLCSCHSYKPLVKDQQVSSEIIKENVIVGKKYEIVTSDKLKMFISRSIQSVKIG
jgi:hypothetical protein